MGVHFHKPDFTAKGDMVVGTGNGTSAIQSIGADGLIIRADSTQSTGWGWVQVLPLAYSNTSVPGGNTVANTTSETAFTSSYTIPANSLAVGNVIKVKLYGVYGTALVSPTLNGKLKLGSTVMLVTGAITAVAGVTNGGWSAEGIIVVQSIGSSGALDAQGYAEFSTAATTSLSVNMPNTGATTVDTTVNQALTVSVQWGTASASNTITLRQMIIEILK